MSKELDDLENYLFNEWKQNHVNFGCDYKLEAELDKQLNNLKSVKQALQRLDKIDNAELISADTISKLDNELDSVICFMSCAHVNDLINSLKNYINKKED